MKANEVVTKTKWSIDQSHSEISFKVRHLMISHVKGGFKTFDASIYTIGKDFSTAEVDLWIDASSIFTGDEKRDEHLKSPDFFDVEKFKQITFTSSNIEKSDEERFASGQDKEAARVRSQHVPTLRMWRQTRLSRSMRWFSRVQHQLG